jgi:hypothetical protein
VTTRDEIDSFGTWTQGLGSIVLVEPDFDNVLESFDSALNQFRLFSSGLLCFGTLCGQQKLQHSLLVVQESSCVRDYWILEWFER